MLQVKRLGMWGGLALSCLAVDKSARGTSKVPAYGNSEEENPPAPCEKSNGKNLLKNICAVEMVL